MSDAASDFSDTETDGNGGRLPVNDEEEIDFYVLLNVNKESSPDEIAASYKRKCLIFHPDRHADEASKRDAERVFVQLRRAYETLSDPKKKVIYDTLGVQGLETAGFELVQRSTNPDSIRREFEFLQRLREQELMLQRTHPQSAFIVKTSLAGLFAENPDERYGPQLMGLAITQSVDCAVTSAHRLGLVGKIRTSNGRGDGNVAATWKTDLYGINFENSVTAATNSLTGALRLSRSVGARGSLILQNQLQYSVRHGTTVPSVALIYSHRLRLQLQGSLIYSWSPIGQSFTTSLVMLNNNLPRLASTLTLSPTNSVVRLAYTHRGGARDHDSVTEASLQLSLASGIQTGILAERRLGRFSRIALGLNASYPSCTLSTRLRLKTGSSVFEWQAVLCDDPDEVARAALYGVLVPYVVVTVGRLIFRPQLERLAAALFLDERARDSEVDSEAREEAARVQNLMRPSAERNRRDEEAKHGVVIVEAK